ncbi:hypothetical protein MUK70_21710 [Dyadobacter chenwenxiniae]|uniref:DUF642 domain-containing protein n=1 Tax=Dyadobacter chenwenxiniae TaxID=2906456 RepID=A0A9X1PIX2_9BACT|nr:hypothetical protein [Dyadobacter chenwenxiniae]MCF0061860.1 hypothetical protein [Dyadobacter chenwenxiniae]UON81675.1 hypothetical protein MUK70_21710 [Dyadobacter chenwenxiniae]
MNLVKQLPLGLSLACLMFMSSCSKEDAVTPGSAVTNESSNLRQGGPVISSVFHLPSTDGPTCVGCAANGWYLKIPARDATSSLTAYAGDGLKKWRYPLPVPSTGSGSILTVISEGKMSGATSHHIKNLIVGKKYKVTFSTSTTSLFGAYGPTPYASLALVSVQDWHVKGAPNLVSKTIDFTGKHSQWITETVEFVATNEDLRFGMYGGSPWEQTQLSYTNFHVGSNAVQQIN